MTLSPEEQELVNIQRGREARLDYEPTGGQPKPYRVLVPDGKFVLILDKAPERKGMVISNRGLADCFLSYHSDADWYTGIPIYYQQSFVFTKAMGDKVTEAMYATTVPTTTGILRITPVY